MIMLVLKWCDVFVELMVNFVICVLFAYMTVPLESRTYAN